MKPNDVVTQLDVVGLLQQNKAALGDLAGTKLEDLHVFMVGGGACWGCCCRCCWGAVGGRGARSSAAGCRGRRRPLGERRHALA
jgi:hypothetical protein